jgi:hypothetical protein
MNRLFGAVVIIGLLIACAAGYFYLNPSHLPGVFRNPTAGFKVLEPRSPLSNFRPPQF